MTARSSLPSRGAEPHLPEGVTVNGSDQPELIHYVMDLEMLVRWLARTFMYEDQLGNRQINDPIWTDEDAHGNKLPDVPVLQRTWDRVMHDA